VVGVAVTLLCVTLIPSMVSAAFLYKSYLVKRDQGRDILCDTYTVQRNDYVLKLLKQKGEISQEDFPEFLAIFQRINPHVRDVNLLRPGEQIFIPLRILQAGDMPGQSTGIVTVPFVALTSLPEQLQPYTHNYTVRPGDTVSVLIAQRFGKFGTRGYKEGIKLFRLMNPDVSILNRIKAGQQLRLPDPGLKKEPWYASLFDGTGRYRMDRPGAIPDLVDPSTPSQTQRDAAEKKVKSALEEAADILEVKLLHKGIYYFPRPGRNDFKLDLTRYPALEFEDGTMTLLPNEGTIAETERADIESMRERLKLVPIAPDAATEDIVESVLEATGRGSARNHLVCLPITACASKFVPDGLPGRTAPTMNMSDACVLPNWTTVGSGPRIPSFDIWKNMTSSSRRSAVGATRSSRRKTRHLGEARFTLMPPIADRLSQRFCVHWGAITRPM